MKRRTVVKQAHRRRHRRGDILLGHRICKVERSEAFWREGFSFFAFSFLLKCEMHMARSSYIIVTEARNATFHLGIGLPKISLLFLPVTKETCHGFESRFRDGQAQSL